jgi:DNA-binding IclR family transcriptional regulator
MDKDRSEDRQFVAALARGLDVLRCFTATTPELGTSDIARITGMPQPTVWRLCYTLLQLGYLVSIPGRQTLRPGIPLLGLGYAVLATQPIAEIALPAMQALAVRYEGAVSLGARDGLSMIYLQRCQGSSIVFTELQVGSRVPLATSATGWAYIAGLEAGARKELIGELKAQAGSDWPKTEKSLIAALKTFEKTGYVVNRGVLHKRINSVAVPIRSEDGGVLLALSAGGIVDVFTADVLAEIGEELMKFAERLAPALARDAQFAVRVDNSRRPA